MLIRRNIHKSLNLYASRNATGDFFSKMLTTVCHICYYDVNRRI